MILYTCCLVADPCPFRLSFFFFKGWVDYIFLKIKKIVVCISWYSVRRDRIVGAKIACICIQGLKKKAL